MAKKEKTITREDRIKNICDSINQGKFGGENKDAVTYLGSREVKEIERFSTGSPDLDAALGGGLPKGRFIELFGAESSGKTTLCYHMIKEFQKAFPEDEIALIDSEYAFDEAYAEKIGVDTRYIIVNQPECGEQAMNIMEELIVQGGVRLIIVDSVAALTTRAEIEGEHGKDHMAQLARLMSNSLKKLAAASGRTGTTIVFTNQIREKIGVTYGETKTTPGGHALKFYASIRINLRRMDSEKEKINGEEVRISNRVRAEVKKNKTAPPFRSADFHITFGIGIDAVTAYFMAAVNRKILEKKGAWFSYDDSNLGQGKSASINKLREDEELYAEIVEAVNSWKPPERTGSAKDAKDIKRPSMSKNSPERVAVEDDFSEDVLEVPVEVEDV
jgi:recombination protein RecA